MVEKNFKINQTEKLPDWEALVTGEISLPFLTTCRKEALKKINESLSLPGFRKGLIPEDVLLKTVGEMAVLEETAEIALAKEYANIIIETGLRPIVRPEIAVTKLAPGIPLEFKISLILEPEFDLPDYKKIAKETEKNEDKEKHRVQILENIIKETKLEVSKKLIEGEIAHTLHHFKHDVEKAGLKWDEYLKKIEKTEDAIKESWREHITTRLKTEFIMGKIAQAEKLQTFSEVIELLEKEA